MEVDTVLLRLRGFQIQLKKEPSPTAWNTGQMKAKSFKLSASLRPATRIRVLVAGVLTESLTPIVKISTYPSFAGEGLYNLLLKIRCSNYISHRLVSIFRGKKVILMRKFHLYSSTSQ